MELKFKEFGESLGTRVLGRKIRQQIEEAINADSCVVFDFEGVRSISHSFSDECFGKLLLSIDFDKIRRQSTFQNVNPKISNTITYTLKERANQLVTA